MATVTVRDVTATGRAIDQAEDLDEEFDLLAEAEVAVVRLVPLVGG